MDAYEIDVQFLFVGRAVLEFGRIHDDDLIVVAAGADVEWIGEINCHVIIE